MLRLSAVCRDIDTETAVYRQISLSLSLCFRAAPAPSVRSTVWRSAPAPAWTAKTRPSSATSAAWRKVSTELQILMYTIWTKVLAPLSLEQMHFQICGTNDGNIIHVFKNCISSLLQQFCKCLK